jgi:uncharacterized protein (TIGR03382 family)
VTITALMLALALGQIVPSDPYVRSHVDARNSASQCLFWTVPKITWHQSIVGNPQTTPAGSEFEAVRRSFQSWQTVFSGCGNLSFEEGAQVTSRDVGYKLKEENRNVVLFRLRRCSDVPELKGDDACWNDHTCNNAYDCWDNNATTIAVTLTTYDEKSGIIYDSDIELNSPEFRFTTVDAPKCDARNTTNCVSTDVQNTMTHEIGHFIGLDHTRFAGSTMNDTAQPGETSKRTIDTGSKDFVCTAYAKGQASKACVHPTTDVELGRKAALAGCSSAGAEAWLPALAGWALLLVRRRRGVRA